MIDLRTKNEYPDATSVGGYLKAYSERLSKALSEIPEAKLQAALKVINEARANKARIYVAGNGGSASIAGHLCCDWMKGTISSNQPAIKVHSLTDSTALFTALANDVSYEHSISEQIKMLGEAGDVVVLISSSGNSPNIVAAAKMAKEKGMKVIGLSGFSGGELNKISDVSLYAPVPNYGIAEDCHQVLMHVLAQYVYLNLKD